MPTWSCDAREDAVGEQRHRLDAADNLCTSM
jgi:hypothetical protein